MDNKDFMNNNEALRVDPDAIVEMPSKGRRRIRIIPLIVCVLIAVVFWYYVMQVDNPNYRQKIEGVEVKLVNEDELNRNNMYVFKGTTYQTDITVNAKKSILNRYSEEDFIATADVMQNYPLIGEQTLDLSVSLPSSISLVGQYTMPVFIDERVEGEGGKVDVIVESKGLIRSSEYEYVLKPDADYIYLSGPRSIISKIDHAKVTADFSDFNDVISSTVFLDDCDVTFYLDKDEQSELSKSEANFIDSKYKIMNVTLEVLVTKEVPVTISSVYGLLDGNGINVEVTPATVWIKGDSDELSTVDSVELEPQIDEKQIKDT